MVKILLATAHLMPTAPTPSTIHPDLLMENLDILNGRDIWIAQIYLSPSSPESDLVMESSDVLCGLRILVA